MRGIFACIFQVWGIKSHKIYFVYFLSKPFFYVITILATFFHETMKLKIPMYFFSSKPWFYLPIFYSLFFKYTVISDCLGIRQ